jgi:hypothetical protein
MVRSVRLCTGSDSVAYEGCEKTLNRAQRIVTFTVFSLLFSVVVTGYSTVVMAEQSRINGLTIALDTLKSSDTPQVIVDFMKRYNYNGLRIYMGWCASFWTGNVNSPMNTKTQTFIDDLCRLCAQNNFLVVCAVSDQVTPFKTAFPQEIQVGPSGEKNSQGNWVCPTGPNFQTFTKNLIKTLIGIMEKYATPRISVDEMVFVTGGGRPTFYSQSMKTAYQQATGKSIPVFTSTSGSYNTEQRQFIEFAKGTIRTFYQMMENTAKTENPNTWFGALVDTYWVYPKTSDDTQPYDYYATVDEVVYEWFYATQNANWNGITDGLRRIKTLNPSALHYFIYGTSTMTSIANMRKSVELAMAEDYYGVFLYEYAKSKSNPFDVSDVVSGGSPLPPPPQPPPPQTQYGTLRFSAWDGENWMAGATLIMTFPNGTVTSGLTPYNNTQAPLGSYTVKCVYSGQTADNSPYNFTLASNEMKSYTFVFGITPPPSPAYVFEDDFDSADFSKWTGIRTSSGETSSVVDTLANQSGFYVRFTSNGRSEVEYAYCYRTVDAQEVWASGNFYVASGLPLGNDGDRLYFIRFMSGRDYVASVGIRRHNGSDKWVLYGRNGSDSAGPIYSLSPAIEMKRWYCVELHWKKHSTLGVLEAFVDGERILLIEDMDTARLGNVSQINFGLMLTLQVPKRVDIYGDYFSFSNVYADSYAIGDINHDGSVNILDIAIVAVSYESKPDQPRWNPIADVNKDGVINILDLALVARDIT